MHKNKRYWQQLCISAAIEENPQRLAEILSELNLTVNQRQAELGHKTLKTRQLGPLEELPTGNWLQ